MQGVAKQFDAVITGLGVRRIDTVGHDFNPELHEAVSMEDGDGEREVVSEELQPGYILENGTVLQHAMVRVKNT